jgi:uncharacterized protein (DUF302 family)
MKTSASDEVIRRFSRWPFLRTLEFIEKAIFDADMTIFARIDHAAGARAIGISMPDMTVLIYGNPWTGTPALIESPKAALELPLRVLVHECDGRVVVALRPMSGLLMKAGVSMAAAERLEIAQRVLLDALDSATRSGPSVA